MDVISELGSRLLMPFALIGGLLLVLETVSWLLVNWKVPQYRFTRNRLRGLLPFVVYVGLLTLSGSNAVPRISFGHAASSITGLVAFLLGWWIRHGHPLTYWLAKQSRLVRRLQWYLSGPMLRTRHPRYFGAWLEIVGFSLIWQSAIASAIALVGFCLSAMLAIEWEERRLVRTVRGEGWQEWRSRSSAFWPDAKVTITLLGTPVLAGLISGVFTRELVLFYSTRDTATTLVISVAQILATVAVLCVAIVALVVEVSSQTYSTRVSGYTLVSPSLGVSLGAFTLTIAYCLGLAAGSGRWFPRVTEFESVWLDLVPFLAAGALASLAIFARDAMTALSPEAMVDKALKPLDARWVGIIRQHYAERRRWTPLRLERDPLIRLEPLLRAAIIQEDRTSFFTAMTILSERLTPLTDADDILMLDTYLGSHFAGLARLAAKHRLEEPLTEIIDFLDVIGVPSDASLQSLKSPLLAGLPGCEVPRVIVEAALDNRLSEPTTLALRRIYELASHWIKVLPAEEDTILYNPERVSQGLSREESNRLFENWMRVRVLADNYVGYICNVASRAAKDNMPDVTRTACNYSLDLARDILDVVKGKGIRRFLMWATLNRVFRAVDTLLGAGHRPGFALMGLGYHFLGPHAVDADAATAFCRFGARILTGASRLHLLDYGSADQIGLMAVGLIKDNPLETMTLLESMTQAMITIRGLPNVLEDEELIMAYDELGDRVRQAIDGAPKEFCREHGKQLQKMVEVANQPFGSAGP